MAPSSTGEIVSFIGDPVTTSLSRAFAVECAESFLDVRLINLADLQPTSVGWGHRRASAKFKPALPVYSVRREDVAAMAAVAEILTIDAPTWDVQTSAWLIGISLFTVIMTGVDEHELDNTLRFARALADDATEVRFVLASCRADDEEEERARSLLNQSGFKLLSPPVRNNTSFVKLQSYGHAISEAPGFLGLSESSLELVQNVQAEYIAAQERRES